MGLWRPAVPGPLASWMGFRLWYRGLQRFQDALPKAEYDAAMAKAPVGTLRRHRPAARPQRRRRGRPTTSPRPGPIMSRARVGVAGVARGGAVWGRPGYTIMHPNTTDMQWSPR